VEVVNSPVFVHGIDEAGYGPLLGPLVLGRADFELTGAKLRLPIRPARIVKIGDSKQLLARKSGFAHLEAAVLGIHASIYGAPPATLLEWMELDSHWAANNQLHQLPWYQDLDMSLPIAASADELTEAWEEVEKGLALSGGVITGLGLRVTDEVALNQSWGLSENKHDSLFTQVAELIEEVLEPAEARKIQVDKLGGRSHYEPKLVGAFPFVPIEILEETSANGHYLLEPDTGPVEISFHVKGDDRFPAIGLASMIAKYTREAFMSIFNDYWRRRAPGILRTAGYYQDGSRFLAELKSTKSATDAEILRMTRGR
jgi:ribonuclease HII